MKTKVCFICPFFLKFLFWAVWLSVLIGFVAFPYGSLAKAAGPEKVIENAMTVVTEIKDVPEGGIPKELLTRCEGLAIFPSVYKGGFVVGASYGKGLMAVRDPKIGNWRGPAFLQIGSGSFGWQIGVQATDLILVINNGKQLTFKFLF